MYVHTYTHTHTHTHTHPYTHTRTHREEWGGEGQSRERGGRGGEGRAADLTAPTLQRIETKESELEEKKALNDSRRKEVEERVRGGHSTSRVCPTGRELLLSWHVPP